MADACPTCGKALSAHPGEGWRGIESAPPNEHVLIFVPRASQPDNLPQGLVQIAYRTDNEPPFVNTWRHALGPGQGTQCGWPTHWRPLPAPPGTDPAAPEIPEELRELSERATAGPWCWEQCGEKEDVPVVGIAYPGDDEAYVRPYAGRIVDDDAFRAFNIASDISGADGYSASANAAFIVACVNYVRSLIGKGGGEG